MDPLPLPTNPNTLPSYLTHLSPHTWYDYTTSPAHALDLPSTPKPNKSKPKSKPKPPTALLPADILTLASLLPSTRPLLFSQKFLKALDLTTEETAHLTKVLKELCQPSSSSDKLGGGGSGAAKRKSKLELLQERELQLAREEGREEAKAEKRKEVRRKRDIDQALGLVVKNKNGKGKGKTYGKEQEGDPTTTRGYQKEEKQETAEQRKKRKMEELDRQLGLLPQADDLAEGKVSVEGNMPQVVGIDQLGHIDTDDTAAIRRAGIDVLLGLVRNNGDPQDEQECQSEIESELIRKAELTRRRIDAEMGLLNSARMAQMDAILGLLSPKKTMDWKA